MLLINEKFIDTKMDRIPCSCLHNVKTVHILLLSFLLKSNFNIFFKKYMYCIIGKFYNIVNFLREKKGKFSRYFVC